MKNVWKIFGMAYVAACGMLLFGANAKAYIDDIIPLEKRTEYQDILDEKNKQDRKY